MGEKIATIEEIKKYCEFALNGGAGIDYVLSQIEKILKG